MTNLRQITLKDFSGGLNTSADKTRVPANQSPDLLNVEVLDSGAIVRRKGYDFFADVGTGEIDLIDRYKTPTSDVIVSHEASTGNLNATVISSGDEPPASYTAVAQNPTQDKVAGTYFTAGEAVVVSGAETITVPEHDQLIITGRGNEFEVVNGAETKTSTNGIATLTSPTTGTVTVTPVPLAADSTKVLTSMATTGTLAGSATATIPNTATAKRITLWQKVTSDAPNQLDPLPGNGYVGLYSGAAPNSNLRFRLIYTVTNRTATTATVALIVEAFVASGTFSESMRGYATIKGSAVVERAINSAPNVLNVGETLTDTYPVNVTGLTASATTIQATFYARKSPYGSADEVIDRTVNLVIPALTTSALTADTTVCGYRLNYLRSASGSLVRAYNPSGVLVATLDKPTDSGWLDSTFAVSGTTVTPTRLNGADVTLPSVTVTAEELAALTVTHGGTVSASPASVTTNVDRVEVDLEPTLIAHTDFTAGTGSTVSNDTVAFRTSNTSYLDTMSYPGTMLTSGLIDTLVGDLAGHQYTDDYHFATTNTDTGADANKLFSYNGTTTSAVFTATSPATFGASCMAVKQDRLFVAGKEDDPAIIEYSAVADATKWATDDGGGALRPVPPGIGEVTQNMAVWKDMLIWFGQRAISAIKTDGDPTEWTVSELTQSFGCVAPKSVSVIPNGVVFLSQNGVTAYGSIEGFGGDGEGFANLSERIRGTLNRVNPAYRHKAVGFTFRGRYFLSLPLDGSTVNNYTLVLKFAEPDVKDDIPSWTLYDYGFASMFDYDGVLLAGGYDGNIYRLETGNADYSATSGVADRRISMRYETPLLGLSNTLKDYREMYVSVDGIAGETLNVTTETDGTVDSPTAIFISPGDPRSKRIPHRKKGNSVSLVIEGTSSTQPITISDITVTYNERKR